MNRDWLWDRRISLNKVKKILGNPQHKSFILFASLLFARKNEPQEVFKEYIDPILFCKNWFRIKRNMRRDKWSNQRIIFWQAVYEKLKEKYQEEGVELREKKEIITNELCKKTGGEIRRIRKEQRLSQEALAKRLGVSQQLISHIEKGRENITLVTLTNILEALNKKINISFL